MSAPALVLLATLLAEAAGLAWRIYRPGRGDVARRMVLWSLRPWGGWAAINLACRTWPDLRYYINPKTFPFFVHTWDAGGALPWLWRCLASPTVWLWGGAALAMGAAMILAVLRLSRRDRPARRETAGGLLLLYLLALGLTLSVNSLPLGAGNDMPGGTGSLVKPWFNAAATMYYDIRVITGGRHYLGHFAEYQPRLQMHARSHPPGASLSLWLIGRIFSLDAREPSRHVYTIGLAILATLNLLLMYALGRAIVGTPAGGWFSAGLWATSPAAIYYDIFAMDAFYLLFFNAILLLALRLATRRPETTHTGEDLLLGVLFTILAMLSYSWCIVTAVVALFLVVAGRRDGLPPAATLLRPARPLAWFALFWFGLLLLLRLNYWEIYRNASAFVSQFYHYRTVTQWATHLVAGQWTLYLMMGSLTCACFVAFLREAIRRRAMTRPLLLYLCTAGVTLIPILVIPALKNEAPRIWNWVTTLPLVFAASWILSRKRPDAWAAAAMGVSLGTAILVRLFVHFSA